MEAENTAKKSFVEIFMEGAFKGWNIGIRSMLTALVLAYALMYMLKASGAMILLERVFSPVMGLFSLPGVAITALVAALMSKPGGVATAVALYTQGVLTDVQVTVMFPALVLMGGLVSQYVRVVVVSGTDKRRHSLLIASTIGVAVLSIPLMNILLGIMRR